MMTHAMRYIRMLGPVFVVVALLNIVAARFDARIDLTSNQMYTLDVVSAQVFDLFGESDDGVVVTVYLSRDLPSPLHHTRERLDDLLQEYQQVSRGVLRYDIVDVSGVEGQAAEQARQDGCEEGALGERSAELLSVRTVFKCLVFKHGTRRQVISNLKITGQRGSDNLEFEVTRALYALGRERSKKIGFVTGLGGPASIPKFIPRARGVFEALYGDAIEPVEVDFSNPDKGLKEFDELDAVVLLNLSQEVSATQRVWLDRYLHHGGAIAWYQSATVPDEEKIKRLVEQLGPTDTLPALRRPAGTGLVEQMASYGVRHRQDLVLDRDTAMEVMLRTLRGRVQARNPAIFQASGLDRDVSFLRHRAFVTMPAPSSLEVLNHGRSNHEVRELVRTQSSAMRFDSPFNTMDYEGVLERLSEQGEQGEHVLMASVSGEFPLYYKGDTMPEGVSSGLFDKVEQGSGRLLIVGSGDFILPQSEFGYDEQLASQGQQLFFQSMEWLVQEDALTRLRDRQLTPFLGEVHPATQSRVQLLNIMLAPLGFLLVGYAMYLRRRRRSEEL